MLRPAVMPHPTPVPTGQFPLNPGGDPGIIAPSAMPSAQVPAQTGPYYPGAAGAPSGIHEMSPGVQAVSGAIASLPGVNPNQPPPLKPVFDHSGYGAAMQNWQAQRMSPSAIRPDKQSFMAPPVV